VIAGPSQQFVHRQLPLARLEVLTPVGFDAKIDLSITDDWPLAQAFVIISAYDARKA